MKQIQITCSRCGKEFLKDKKEYDRQLRNNLKSNFFCSKKCFKEHRIKPPKKLTCNWCGKEFYSSNKPKDLPKFCSKKCCNKNNRLPKWSDEQKKQISVKQKKYIKNNPECAFALNSGRHDRPTQKRYFSSKGEREVVKYFKENFKIDEWKSGGKLNFKNVNFSRDMWSDKLKVCFEYDGIWHFKDIHNQLSDKQMKDKFLEEWCILNNYRLVRISESEYQKNKPDMIKKLISTIYNNDQQIIKLGKEYYSKNQPTN